MWMKGARSAIWAVTYIVFLDWHFMFSRGFEQIALVDGIDGRLASTPAMFNSTITEREDILCPVHGAIMITGCS